MSDSLEDAIYYEYDPVEHLSTEGLSCDTDIRPKKGESGLLEEDMDVSAAYDLFNSAKYPLIPQFNYLMREFEDIPSHKEVWESEAEETPAMRFNRLVAEIEDFKSLMQTNKTQKNSPFSDQIIDASLTKLEGLHTQLIESRSTEQSKTPKAKQVKTRCQNLLNTLQQEPGDRKASPMNMQALKQLEERVTKIESVLGWKGIPMPYPDIQTGILTLAEKVRALDKDKIEMLSHACTHVSREADVLLQKKAELSNLESERKVDELYQACNRWLSSGNKLALLTQRLESLKYLHQTGGSFSDRLNLIEKQQAEVEISLLELKESLQEVKRKMGEKLEKIINSHT